MDTITTLPRDVLSKALGGNPRVVAAFERQATQVQVSADSVAANEVATGALQDARFLTLGPNDALTNERVLRIGSGLKAVDDGTHLTITTGDDTPHVQGGFAVYLTAQALTRLVLPGSGTLATIADVVAGTKHITGLPTYATDAAAGTGGLTTGYLYQTATGELRIKL